MPFIYFFRNFAAMNTITDSTSWCENIILADGDYIDKVAFDLTVNFERMIGRRIPKADLARWAECVALDGGLRKGGHNIHLILLHDQSRLAMQNFTPGHYLNDINGKAFGSTLGEFSMSAVSSADIAPKDELFRQTVEYLASQNGVRRLMVIPAEENLPQVREALRKADPTDMFVTLFGMQPMTGGQFRTEILGYSLMSALGIRGDELK